MSCEPAKSLKQPIVHEIREKPKEKSVAFPNIRLEEGKDVLE